MRRSEERGLERTTATAPFEKLVARWQAEEAAARVRARELRRRVAEDARPVFERYGVERAVLFGSIAEGRCREGSDVDLLVVPLRAEDYASCWRDLENAVGHPWTSTPTPTIPSSFRRSSPAGKPSMRHNVE